jgi:aspartate carbamoyltransferase catalytic subunit
MTAEGSASAMRHLVSIDQVDASTGSRIFELADEMAANIHSPETRTRLAGAVIALLFFEASSRTVLSFSAAAARLGAAVVTHQAAEASSLAKGESIEDTIRVVSSYVDAIVLRHPESGIAARAARASSVPLINGGDGGNEHPTQALIDLYTINKNLSQLHGLRVAMGFDPLHSRAIRSLCRGLSHYRDNQVTLVGPRDLWMPEGGLDDLRSRGLRVIQTDDPDALLEQDVAYVNRFQSERIVEMKDPERLRKRYRLTAQDVARSSLKLILDPLPRVHELEEGIDALPQAAYFEQVRSGVPIRMALLSIFAGRDDIGVARPWIAATGVDGAVGLLAEQKASL